MNMRLRKSIVAAGIVAAFAAAAMAQLTVTKGVVPVEWTFATSNVDGSPFTDLAGAKVYYGTTSSNYTRVVDVPGGTPGASVKYTVTGLVAGVTYYLNGTAYNRAGLESDFCTEIRRPAKPVRPGKHSTLK
jgi:hypothetical protein